MFCICNCNNTRLIFIRPSSIRPLKNCWWNEDILSTTDATQSYRDFVLISEFSELEGPLPLAVVAKSAYIDLKFYTESQCPNHPHLQELKNIGLNAFDFNAFVLRVVSVDRSTEYESVRFLQLFGQVLFTFLFMFVDKWMKKQLSR